MKSIIFVIYYNFLVLLSACSIKPNLCVDCKFFRKTFLLPNRLGKCALFPYIKEQEASTFLVDGISFSTIDYEYCSIVREYRDICGKEGKKFQNKDDK